MRIDATVEMPFSREEVFRTYRDNLSELVPFLHNVRAITNTSRDVEGDVVKLLNRWKGGGDIPGLVRKFLSDELLEWDDYATWNQATWKCDWRTVVPAFKDAVDARGSNDFTERGPNACTLRIMGELKVDASKIKIVPRLLAGTVGPAIEAFLVTAIKPNLVSVARGVEQFLKAKKT